jgi:hypothetical protein
MFGVPLSIAWAVTYVKNGTTYYLSEIISDAGKFVWTTKKDKAKKYATLPAATDAMESIKVSRKNKKSEIKVTQV